MKKKFSFGSLAFCCWMLPNHLVAQYNTIMIPDTLSGTTFNLSIKDTFTQLIATGNQTVTGGINSNFWGPTLFVNKGDIVHMNVTNNLNDSTTLHWHGLHLPAVMDGGPHQIIPPNTLWQPYWEIKNNAATYWYHPHLHEMTTAHLTKGIGGLIIVRDAIESALALPRTYGVDDIPLILTDRTFDASNQFIEGSYGDSMMTNGVLHAQFTVPAQVVRFRVLNGAISRTYNLGFSDGRTFYIITSDGGLLDAPVAVTQYLLHAGERIEILVNCSGQAGTSVDLKAYNSTLPTSMPGGENATAGPLMNALDGIDFNILHLNIGTATTSPITTIPTTLTTNTLLLAADADVTRTLTFSDTVDATGKYFIINHKAFDMTVIDYEVTLDNTEIWEVHNMAPEGHPFHIHDVQFNVLTVNGVAATAAQSGWKDVVYIPGSLGPTTPSVVRLITKFEDFADTLHPFMFHCHMAHHEDEGMMGQFIIKDATTSIRKTEISSKNVNLYPNPAIDKVYLSLADPTMEIYYIRILDAVGRTIYMLPQPQLQNGIDISHLGTGIYYVQITDKKTKQTVTKKLVVE